MKRIILALALIVAASTTNASIVSIEFTDTQGELGTVLLDTSYADTNPDLDSGNYSLDAIKYFSYRGGNVTGIYTAADSPTLSILSFGFDNGSWSTNLDLWFWPDGVDLVNQLASNPSDYSSIGGHIFIDWIGAVDFENVMVTAVPIPAAVWLFGSGLIGLISVAKRKKS